ncbi:uncharacterized protein LOC116457721 isoform X2 [Hylobates moloch]|uniref:uncharacterized protein LOC116457721 isoform X2 n=1 Tax=Hylobates moloch TaxID=81572 RepID=UPI00267540AB|nr:uncharacterized protein LOC116457721 isoform X2 [Hylobates moloch]
MAGMVDFQDEEQVKSFLENMEVECNYQCYHEKDPDGCYRLVDYLEGIRKNFDEAAKVLKFNCEENQHSDSCYKLGAYYVTGKGTVQVLVSSSLWTLNSAALYPNSCLSHLHSTSQCTKCFQIQWFVGLYGRLCGTQLSTHARPPDRSQPARTSCLKRPEPTAWEQGVQSGYAMWGCLLSCCSLDGVWGFSKPKHGVKGARPSPGNVHCHSSHLPSQIQDPCWGRSG